MNLLNLYTRNVNLFLSLFLFLLIAKSFFKCADIFYSMTLVNIKVCGSEKISYRKRSIDTSNNRRCKSSERNTSNRYRAKFVSMCCCSLISRFLPHSPSALCLPLVSLLLSNCVSHLALCCNEQKMEGGKREGGGFCEFNVYLYRAAYTTFRVICVAAFLPTDRYLLLRDY